MNERGFLQHKSENTRKRRRRRQIVLERDGHRCVDCGSTEDLKMDHVVPLSRGGTHRIANRQTLCAGCDAAKGNSLAGVSPRLIQAERAALAALR